MRNGMKALSVSLDDEDFGRLHVEPCPPTVNGIIQEQVRSYFATESLRWLIDRKIHREVSRRLTAAVRFEVSRAFEEVQG